MSTTIYFNPSTLVSYQDAYTASGTGWRYPPSTADFPRLYDGTSSAGLGMVFFDNGGTYGWLEVGYPALTPPAGAAWDAIRLTNTNVLQWLQNTTAQVRVISISDQSKSSTIWKFPDNTQHYPLAASPKTGSNDLRTFAPADMYAVIEVDAAASRAGGFGAAGGFYMILSDFQLQATQYSRPTLAVTAPSPVAGATVVDTAKPNITWTFTGDGLSQAGYRVRIFNAAQYGAGGFNPQTSTATYDSGDVVSASTNHRLTANLTTGTTYRAYVWAWTELPVSKFRHTTYDGTTVTALGQPAYTQFTINLTPPPAPTAIIPVAGATVSTDTPTLGATLTASSIAGATVRGEWQLATNSSFSANLRTLTEAIADLRTMGATTEALPAGTSELFQGTWYIRARELDSNGLYGAYSAFQSFVVSHVPSAGSLSPSGQASRGGAAVTFSWAFSDPSPTDFQTAYQVIIERDSDGAVVVDSGKITSTSTTYSYTIPAGYMDTLLRWRVRVYDSDNVVSAYTANQQFFARTPPVVAITFPTTQITSPTPTVTWTVTEPAGSGRVQTQYLVTISEAGAEVYSSGWVASASGSHFVSNAVMIFGHTYTVTVTVQDDTGIQGSASVTAPASWTPPPNPDIVADVTVFDSAGYVRLTWPQNRDPNFINYKVYRRTQGDATWLLLATITDPAPATYTFDDYTAPSQPQEYAVTQTATIFGVVIESTPDPLTADVVGTHYWIVVPSDTALSTQLSNVKEDSFTDEWEQEVIQLIGRGRRVERGTHFGRTGTLSASVRDYYAPGTSEPTRTAREIRLAMEAMKRGVTEVYLRTPFGDYWKVVLGDLEVARVSGVGRNEYFDISVPYIEVS